ncbi:TraB/GumN family protein [Cellulophaga sp. HaHaR_3_176]|nr:TraB/GumN family protein [Cellulophaga sp. HaHaR_3_176]
MRLLITFIFLLFFGQINAQEQNSLLWEISGNGLSKTSYLYGTMHVSKKIAFRLDDVFYEALNKSEVVALESDPNTWLDNEDNMGFGYGESFITTGFYTRPFTMSNPKKEEIAAYLGLEDQMINNILYRTDEYSQNFEEDTYLDMFIYQAGSKYLKPIVALEDLEESTTLVGRASFNSTKEKPAEWLQKKMQQQGALQLLQDAYRERNINLLDSIDQGMYTEHYLKNMLYVRNKNMVTMLDSIIQKSKVFTGIGAAHLPGKKGVISLLRQKGYTVKALQSKASKKGIKLKEQFEEKIKDNSYQIQSVDDNTFSLLLPNKLYPVAEFSNTFYISPDLANGSFFTANRIPTFSYLRKGQPYTIDDIDNLLFENIPGKIVEKNKIERNGYKGLDIKNILKNGESQRYQIFITPLEIIIFKMGGNGTYVKQFSDTVFNSIRFKKLENKPKIVSSVYKDFSVEMPSNYTFTNTNRNGTRLIQGFDSINNTYRFLKKITLHDYDFIEKDTFELKQIQKRFYQDLKLKEKYNSFKTNSLSSSATIDSLTNKKLHLFTEIDGENYYLLGIVTSNTEDSKRYFDSFKVKKPIYTEEFKKVKDTALFFTTVSPVKPPKFVVNSNGYNKKEIKDYNAFSKKTIYQNKNNEAIAVQVNKSHDLLMFTDIDSVWTLRKMLYVNKKYIISNETKQVSNDGNNELVLTLTDTASTRGILIKNISKGGLLYEIKAVIDTIKKPSKFVSEFFDNFKPTDTIIGKNILKDKTSIFFKALRNNDSIILNGYQLINFKKKDIDSLKFYVSEFQFKENQKNIQSYLIQRLAMIDDSKTTNFYSDFYQESYNNSSSQTKILQAVSNKKTQESVVELLNLMSKDLPLVSSNYEIYKIFKPYVDSLPLAKKLYPEILDFSTIEEYKSPIFSLLAKLKSKDYIKAKTYKKYRKQMLNDAKIQLKRELGKTTNYYEENSYYNDFIPFKQTSVLEDYIQLLHPFIKEKEVQLFFDRLDLIKNADLQTTKIALLAGTTSKPKTKEITSLAKNINSRNLLFTKLKKVDKLNFFPPEYKTQKLLAEAQLFSNKNYKKNIDSILFITERNIKFENKDYTAYAFKYRKNDDYDKNFSMYLAVYLSEGGLKDKPLYQNSGIRIEDTETDEEALNLVIEEFILKDRPRAEIYRPNQVDFYNYYDY